jgi:HEAT repeat protein
VKTWFLFLIAGLSTLSAQTPSEKAWTLITNGASDKSADKRALAIRALGLIPNDAKAEGLAETALADPKPEVRTAGAEALGQMGATKSIPKLKAALKDTEVQVVLSAASSLLMLKDPSGYEVYYAILTGERKSGDSLMESQMKMIKDPKALASFGFETGIGFIPYAGAGYGAYKMLTKDDATPVRSAAALRLASDPDPKSGEALAKTITDKKWALRAAIAHAIAKRNDPALLDAVITLLDDDNENVRANAAAAVIKLSKHPKRK